MEDHHVDRLDVEVWQHMELTNTNNSIGLITILTYREKFYIYQFPGDNGNRLTPDPIPNSTVKAVSADGTLS